MLRPDRLLSETDFRLVLSQGATHHEADLASVLNTLVLGCEPSVPQGITQISLSLPQIERMVFGRVLEGLHIDANLTSVVNVLSLGPGVNRWTVAGYAGERDQA